MPSSRRTAHRSSSSTRPSRPSASPLANAQNLLELEAIIVGGGLGDRLGELFVRRVEAAMATNLRFPASPPWSCRPSSATCRAPSAPPC